MANFFSLKICAADKVYYEGEAVSLTIPAVDGFLQILAGHEDMVIAVVDGTAVVRPDETSESLPAIVGSGFVHVKKNQVTMLVQYAEHPDEIDQVRAQRALEAAQEKLRRQKNRMEYQLTQAALSRALARLSAGGLKSIK